MKRLRGPAQSFHRTLYPVADSVGAAFRRAAQARSAIQTVLSTGTRSLSRIRYSLIGKDRGRGRIWTGRPRNFMNNSG